MSAASNIHSLLARLLPERIVPAPARPGQRHRLFAGVGMPAQQALSGERFGLIDRLDEAVDLQAVYHDLCRQALLGNVAALNDLGWVWLNGKYWRGDTVLAGHLLRMAALQGNAAAWFNRMDVMPYGLCPLRAVSHGRVCAGQVFCPRGIGFRNS